jgi:hypothetical protein
MLGPSLCAPMLSLVGHSGLVDYVNDMDICVWCSLDNFLLALCRDHLLECDNDILWMHIYISFYREVDMFNITIFLFIYCFYDSSLGITFLLVAGHNIFWIHYFIYTSTSLEIERHSISFGSNIVSVCPSL